MDGFNLHRRQGKHFPFACLCALAMVFLNSLVPTEAVGQGWSSAYGGQRAALVIGNGAYKQQPLKNPVNDARAIAENLETLGFTVTLRENPGMRDMLEAIREFSIRSKNSSVRLVFYAGHGIQVKGRNYLIPVDSQIASDEDIPRKGVDVTELVERLSQFKDGLNILILDACRNNPFEGGVAVGPDGRRFRFRGATPSGLAPVEAPLGTLIAFSTAPGSVAMDGAGDKNSLYVKHLLKHMDTPGLPVEQMFKRVRIEVAQQSQRLQVPWESSSLMGDFCFLPGPNRTCAASNRLFTQ
jgi:uncharacterized caspase-like protein